MVQGECECESGREGGVRERDWALPGFALSPQSR